jgi:hypothetical protein
MNAVRFAAATLLVSILFVACGGGWESGGDLASEPSQTSTPVATATAVDLYPEAGVGEPIPLPGAPRTITAGGGAVWVSYPGKLVTRVHLTCPRSLVHTL